MCNQAKITICCHTPLVVPIALKIFTWGSYVLNPHLESDLRFDHSKQTSIYEFLPSGQQTSKKLFTYFFPNLLKSHKAFLCYTMAITEQKLTYIDFYPFTHEWEWYRAVIAMLDITFTEVNSVSSHSWWCAYKHRWGQVLTGTEHTNQALNLVYLCKLGIVNAVVHSYSKGRQLSPTEGLKSKHV